MKSGGGGGGGDRDKLPESKGSLPRFALQQITPPTIVVRNEQPRLPAEPTVVGPFVLTVPATSQIGNPLSAILQPPSNGTGFGGGLGTGSGGGIGSGEGPGVGTGYGGGIGGGLFRVGGGVSAPRPISILTRSIRKRLAAQSTRARCCFGSSLAPMAGRAISACNGRLAWASMKKPSRQFGSGSSSPR